MAVSLDSKIPRSIGTWAKQYYRRQVNGLTRYSDSIRASVVKRRGRWRSFAAWLALGFLLSILPPLLTERLVVGRFELSTTFFPVLYLAVSALAIMVLGISVSLEEVKYHLGRGERVRSNPPTDLRWRHSPDGFAGMFLLSVLVAISPSSAGEFLGTLRLGDIS
jgi:hypothetical protein